MRKAVQVNLSRQEVISKDKEWITGLKRLITSGAYESLIPPDPEKAFLQIYPSRVNIMQQHETI